MMSNCGNCEASRRTPTSHLPSPPQNHGVTALKYQNLVTEKKDYSTYVFV